MAIVMKAFHFVVYSLLIYGFFQDKLAKIGAEDPALGRKVNKVSGQERDILILNEELADVRVKRETERRAGVGKAESHSTIDDEDGEFEENGDLGSGKTMDIQGDDPGDQNLEASNVNTKPELNGTALRVGDLKTSTANIYSTIVLTVGSWTTSNVIETTKYVHDVNITSSATAVAATATTTPLLITAHRVSADVPNTADIEASVLSSVKSSSRESIISTRDGTRASVKPSSVLVLSSSSARPTAPATKQPSTIETTTKESNDVQNQKDPSPKRKEKKTLFGFVTIEILVALLAGAACAIILLIFLVHRLKKRNEGSYELQEMLMLKSGGYAEEKEVFV